MLAKRFHFSGWRMGDLRPHNPSSPIPIQNFKSWTVALNDLAHPARDEVMERQEVLSQTNAGVVSGTNESPPQARRTPPMTNVQLEVTHA